MVILLIVESPSKCGIIEKYLGSGYKVIGSCGHITSLSTLEQINFDTYAIKYKNEKLPIIKKLREEIKKASEVILATDDDREGEAIAWHICNVCKLDIKNTSRIKFNEITPNALRQALDNPCKIDINRVNSQRCRQVLDLYIGYKISPILWKYITHKLSAGRCQTPALQIIHDNEKEHLLKEYSTTHEIVGVFTHKNLKMNLSHTLDDSCVYLDECKEHEFKLLDISKKTITEKPPAILTTSSLQQLVSQSLSLSPIMTMNLAQVLYENGLITYMRTDCASYSDEFKQELEMFIQKKYGNEMVNHIQDKDKKAHEGIRVTQLNISETTFENNRINKLYKFIYKHTLQTCMTDSVSIKTKYIISAPRDYYFTYNESQFKFKGWKLLNKDKDDESMEVYLRDTINRNVIYANETLINPVFHLTEAQLVKQLEKKGIGRPSTYASILEKLKDKKYVIKGKISGKKINVTNYILSGDDVTQETKDVVSQEESSKLQITALGTEVIQLCYVYYEHLFNYGYTNDMENKLDLIETTGQDWKQTITLFKNDVDKEVVIDMKKTLQVSINCGTHKSKPVIIHSGRYGYYAEYNKVNNSLKDWMYYENIEYMITEQSISPEQFISLIDYISVVKITNDLCIKKGPYGDYLYYTGKKKPRCLKLEIDSRDKTDIKEYIKKKYNIVC
jgi:DNA topoisomerase-1